VKIIHCSYHKCLTVYYSRVFSSLYNRVFRFGRGYKHFYSFIDDFSQESGHYKIASLNNHAIDLQSIGDDFRISRFIRDPRDLVVSGYFYHKRGAEIWPNKINPSEADWKIVNGCIPENMGNNHSFASYLQSLSQEDGLIAEIDFRKNHFDSMGRWPISDPRIAVYKYEDLIGNELDIYEEIFKFYKITWLERKIGLILADHFSAKKQANKIQHIRNPKKSQWKEHFTPKVQDYFERKYGGLLQQYGYE
jgi:Sulfotransferase domain